MARSTFEGPILAGDNRFNALRSVGSPELRQYANMNLINTVPNTANYSGVSQQAVVSNSVPNTNVTIYSPSATAYPPTVQSLTADTTSQQYRYWVAYVPTGSRITDISIYVTEAPNVTSYGYTGTFWSISNKAETSGTYTAGAYGYVAQTSSLGRQNVIYSVTQLSNLFSTSTDILTPNGQPNLSQVVITAGIVSGAGSVPVAYANGKFSVSIGYVQPDNNIGTTTAYPNGNFD